MFVLNSSFCIKSPRQYAASSRWLGQTECGQVAVSGRRSAVKNMYESADRDDT